jgi:hypothetical protein
MKLKEFYNYELKHFFKEGMYTNAISPSTIENIKNMNIKKNFNAGFIRDGKLSCFEVNAKVEEIEKEAKSHGWHVDVVKMGSHKLCLVSQNVEKLYSDEFKRTMKHLNGLFREVKKKPFKYTKITARLQQFSDLIQRQQQYLRDTKPIVAKEISINKLQLMLEQDGELAKYTGVKKDSLMYSYETTDINISQDINISNDPNVVCITENTYLCLFGETLVQEKLNTMLEKNKKFCWRYRVNSKNGAVTCFIFQKPEDLPF